MAEEQFCQSCEERHDCKQIYQQIGGSKGSSVALSVFLVFLLPIAVFIVGLAVSQKLFTRLIQSQGIVTLTSVIFAASVTFLGILVVRSILKNR